MSNMNDYLLLAEKLDLGVPRLSLIGAEGEISKTWLDYLKVLVDPEDIKYLLKIPTMPNSVSLKRYAKRIKKTEDEALQVLNRLINSDCVMKVGSRDPKYSIQMAQLLYNLPTLSYLKYPREKAQKLAELSTKLFIEEGWHKRYSGSSQTPFFRVIPVQESLKTEPLVMPYDQMEKLIDDSRYLSLSSCMCRMRTELLGVRKCKDKYPLETCISLNQSAKFLIERGLAREISKEEAKKLSKDFNKMGLVNVSENYSDGAHLLFCNCCSCCCNILGGILRGDNPRSAAASNFVAIAKNQEDCEKCGTCAEKCIFNAILMKDDGPEFNKEKCMGCGICVLNCPSSVIELEREEKEQICKDFIELGLKVGRETH